MILDCQAIITILNDGSFNMGAAISIAEAKRVASAFINSHIQTLPYYFPHENFEKITKNCFGRSRTKNALLPVYYKKCVEYE